LRRKLVACGNPGPRPGAESVGYTRMASLEPLAVHPADGLICNSQSCAAGTRPRSSFTCCSPMYRTTHCDSLRYTLQISCHSCGDLRIGDGNCSEKLQPGVTFAQMHVGSSDSKWIAYTDWHEIYRVSVDSRAPEKLTSDWHLANPTGRGP
jgi:hypothetical protein